MFLKKSKDLTEKTFVSSRWLGHSGKAPDGARCLLGFRLVVGPRFKDHNVR